MSSTLDDIIQRVRKMPADKQAVVVDSTTKFRQSGFRWMPNPGSQTDAFLSEADEIGYGGEAGPGKTAWLVGLSLTQHQRTLFLRRTNKEASKIVEEYEKVLGTRTGFNGQDDVWRLSDGRMIDMGGCQNEHDKQKFKGNPHDLIAFDQVEDFSQSQYEFIITWNRSTQRGQRCRIAATMNPPTSATGLWVLKRWGAWLDPKHPDPAKSGELRWFTTINGEDTEVDGPGPHMVDGQAVMAKSRTFIRGYLNENPDLAGTGYEGRLAGLPQNLREAYKEGKFESALRDAPNQCIPTDWIRAAQARWTPKPPLGIPMCTMGVDASGGGSDPMVIAIRHDGWYAPMIEIPGDKIPMDRSGAYCSGMIVSYRRDEALVVVDLGGGYGGPIYEHLKGNKIETSGFKGAEGTTRRTRDKKLGFTNKRTAAYWSFREALDPGQPGGSPIALPPSRNLLPELACPTFEVPPNGLKLEPKESVVERLGHSPNEADAAVMAWFEGAKEITSALEWADARQSGGKRLPKVIMDPRHHR